MQGPRDLKQHTQYIHATWEGQSARERRPSALAVGDREVPREGNMEGIRYKEAEEVHRMGLARADGQQGRFSASLSYSDEYTRARDIAMQHGSGAAWSAETEERSGVSQRPGRGAKGKRVGGSRKEPAAGDLEGGKGRREARTRGSALEAEMKMGARGTAPELKQKVKQDTRHSPVRKGAADEYTSIHEMEKDVIHAFARDRSDNLRRERKRRGAAHGSSERPTAHGLSGTARNLVSGSSGAQDLFEPGGYVAQPVPLYGRDAAPHRGERRTQVAMQDAWLYPMSNEAQHQNPMGMRMVSSTSPTPPGIEQGNLSDIMYRTDRSGVGFRQMRHGSGERMGSGTSTHSWHSGGSMERGGLLSLSVSDARSRSYHSDPRQSGDQFNRFTQLDGWRSGEYGRGLSPWNSYREMVHSDRALISGSVPMGRYGPAESFENARALHGSDSWHGVRMHTAGDATLRSDNSLGGSRHEIGLSSGDRFPAAGGPASLGNAIQYQGLSDSMRSASSIQDGRMGSGHSFDEARPANSGGEQYFFPQAPIDSRDAPPAGEAQLDARQ